MGKQGISQRKKLAAIFASFTVLIVGTASLLESMSLDYYSVIGTLGKILPASLALGGIGWFMGIILDKPRKRSKISYNNLLLNEMMKNNTEEVNAHNANILETNDTD